MEMYGTHGNIVPGNRIPIGTLFGVGFRNRPLEEIVGFCSRALEGREAVQVDPPGGMGDLNRTGITFHIGYVDIDNTM